MNAWWAAIRIDATTILENLQSGGKNEHTGTQTVARSLIERAVNEI